MIGKFIKLIMFTLLGVMFMGLIVSTGDSGDPENWTSYRGPNRDGISLSKVPLKVWEKGKTPKLVWKIKIGDGFSGIVLSGNQLITAFAAEGSEMVASFDRMTGKENWRCKISKEFKEEFGNGPRATPIIDEDLAYVYSSYGNLGAVNINTGKLVWSYALADSLKIKVPQYGHSTTPIVVGDKLIIHAGSFAKNCGFFAFDKKTGKILWQTGESTVSYSSPIHVTIDGTEQVIFAATSVIEVNGKRKGKNEVVSYSPDGKKLWTGPSLPGVIAMPVFVSPNKLFVSGSNDIGCYLLQINKQNNEFKADSLWFSSEMQNHFNSSVYYNNHLYGFSNATLHCVDIKTGQRLWRKRGFGKGSLIVADNKLVILSDKGELMLAETNPKEYVELSKAKVIKGLTWTSPTIADGKIYLRSREEMACYDLSK